VADENRSVGEFTDKTIVVTGANSGIGLAAAQEFARRGARVALVGRDQARLDAAVAEIPGSRGFQADFASFDSVRGLAAALLDSYESIDVLCNNAGAVVHSRQSTVDGYELTIQANHLAPFLLSHLLRERLAGGRIVNTASDAHTGGKLDPAHLDSPGPYRAMTVYGSSKQANILFAAEAARRWPEILSFSYHPGVVRTRFGRGNTMYSLFYKVMPFLVTPEGGADTMVWLAGTPAAELVDGGYYVKRKLGTPNAVAASPTVAASLWEQSAKAVGL
jgi:NAD(P)-dependent dehydrogenase (short-subunit alcohol dehydrogenase family)